MFLRDYVQDEIGFYLYKPQDGIQTWLNIDE